MEFCDERQACLIIDGRSLKIHLLVAATRHCTNDRESRYYNANAGAVSLEENNWNDPDLMCEGIRRGRRGGTSMRRGNLNDLLGKFSDS